MEFKLYLTYEYYYPLILASGEENESISRFLQRLVREGLEKRGYTSKIFETRDKDGHLVKRRFWYDVEGRRVSRPRKKEVFDFSKPLEEASEGSPLVLGTSTRTKEAVGVEEES